MGWIKNVLLETRREEIANNIIDAKGYLALPSLADNHIHLDKGHFGGKWQAVVPMDSVAERIEEERGFLREFLKDTQKKAQALIDLITGRGATFLRVQVNVDPVSRLDNLKIIKEVLEKNKHKLDYELVIFPQHGTLRTEAEGLLSEALKNNTATVLGGLDPATIDRDIEVSLDTTFSLAKKYQKKIDIHLHDRGSLGIYEINRIIDYIEAFRMQGKVQISHAFALGDISDKELIPIARRLKEAGVAINTTVPIDIRALSIPVLRSEGVIVNIINDNIHDHWSPFGTGDLIERASRGAEVFSWKDEVSLATALGVITKGLTPLDMEGNQVWPKVGDKANILFAKAESSAHLIGRVCLERVVMFKGTFVFGNFK